MGWACGVLVGTLWCGLLVGTVWWRLGMVEVLGDDEQELVWDGERLGEWLGDGGCE